MSTPPPAQAQAQEHPDPHTHDHDHDHDHESQQIDHPDALGIRLYKAVLANEIPMGSLPDPMSPPYYIFDCLPERKNGLFHTSIYKMPQLFRDLNIPADSMDILSDSRYLDTVDAPTELKQSSQEETSKNKHASICRVDVYCKDETSDPVVTLKGRVESVFNVENRGIIALEKYSEAQGGDASRPDAAQQAYAEVWSDQAFRHWTDLSKAYGKDPAPDGLMNVLFLQIADEDTIKTLNNVISSSVGSDTDPPSQEPLGLLVSVFTQSGQLVGT